MSEAPQAIDHDFRILHLPLAVSTSDEAMARARAGDAGDLWVVADVQTAGRGRQGRVWSSPPGNLYASLLLIDPAPMAQTPQIGFLAALALAEAVEDACGTLADLRIKWPNDLLIAGAKVAGILVEGTSLPDRRFACVIGFGVNCASHPDGLPYAATHLSAHGGAVAPRGLVDALACAMRRWLGIWKGGTGFPDVRTAWLARAAGLGAAVRVIAGARCVEGTMRGIDADGRLVVATPQGEVTIEAGDVFLAPASNRAAHTG